MNYPNRPTHPDFALLSAVLRNQDERADAGQSLEELTSRFIDLDTLVYAAKQQIAMMRAQLPKKPVYGGGDLDVMMQSAFLSAFIFGVRFEQYRETNGGHNWTWTVDYTPENAQPGQRIALLGAFHSLEDAESFIAGLVIRDPEGVDAGRYGINGPNEDDEDDEPAARVHKAAPGLVEGYCAVCGQHIRRVPGGHGMTWVHSDSGAVAAPNPPGIKH